MSRVRTVAKSYHELVMSMADKNSTILRYKKFSISRSSMGVTLHDHKYDTVGIYLDTRLNIIVYNDKYTETTVTKWVYALSRIVKVEHITTNKTCLVLRVLYLNRSHITNTSINWYEIIRLYLVKAVELIISRSYNEYNQIYGNGKISHSNSRHHSKVIKYNIDTIIERLNIIYKKNNIHTRSIIAECKKRTVVNDYLHECDGWKCKYIAFTYTGSYNNIFNNGIFTESEYAIIDNKNKKYKKQ